MTTRLTQPLRGGAIGNTNRFLSGNLAPEAEYRSRRSRGADSAYDDALNDPVGTAGLFRGFYQDAADAFTAQAGRDFQRNIGTVAGNIGRRFGGNASSYEQAQVNKAGDVFSRNLTENLAGLAPQAAAQGLQYTGMLGQRSQNAAGNYDQIQQLILQALMQQRNNEKSKGSGLLGKLGGVLGGVGGFIAGGPAGGAAGAQIGGRL